jgi:hypothetical protein
MEIDYFTKDSVKDIIKESGLSKFIICKAGNSRHIAPVYESVQSAQSNLQAVKSFEKWADITNNSNAYEMYLFDEYDDMNSKQDENAKRKKSKCVKFSFCLQSQREVKTEIQTQVQAPAQQLNSTEIVEAIYNKLKADQESDRMGALEKKIDAFMNGDDDDDDDDEEEEEAEKKRTDQTLFIINKVEGILERFNIIPAKKEAVAISGASETATENKSLTQEQIDEINKYFVVLIKHDKKFIHHLKLLSELATNKPDIYNIAIEQLIKM